MSAVSHVLKASVICAELMPTAYFLHNCGTTNPRGVQQHSEGIQIFFYTCQVYICLAQQLLTEQQPHVVFHTQTDNQYLLAIKPSVQWLCVLCSSIRGGRIDPSIDNIDTNADIGIRSILAR